LHRSLAVTFGDLGLPPARRIGSGRLRVSDDGSRSRAGAAAWRSAAVLPLRGGFLAATIPPLKMVSNQGDFGPRAARRRHPAAEQARFGQWRRGWDSPPAIEKR
jgi:hypothetical protein